MSEWTKHYRSSPHEQCACVYVPANTILEVKKVITGDASVRYLVCSSESRQYAFKESTLVNFTAVDGSEQDDNVYSLSEVQTVAMCPACVQFEPVFPGDIPYTDDSDAFKMHILVGGPLEVLEFSVKSVMLALLKPANGVTNMAVIPRSLQSSITVKVDMTRVEAKDFISTHFENYRDHYVIRKMLYAVPVDANDENKLIWLRKRLPVPGKSFNNTLG